MSFAPRLEIAPSSRQSKGAFHLRWVLAHEPVALFEPAAREFSRLVAEGTDGAVRVDVLSLSDYSPGKRLALDNVQDELKSGRLQMVQTPVSKLGYWQAPFWALEAPFLFRSHEHAARVLDGEIGRGLLDTLRPMGLRGLAFTYSGGYRILSTSGKELRRADELQGLRVRICHTPVAAATMHALGAETIQSPVSEITVLTRAGKIDAAESTWARYWDQRHDAAQPVVHETGHSLLLTSIVLQESIFQSMPKDMQDVLVRSALVVAKQEREFSVQQGEKAREAALKAGVKVVVFDEGEREKFAARALSARAEIRDICGAGLLDAIEAQA